MIHPDPERGGDVLVAQVGGNILGKVPNPAHAPTNSRMGVPPSVNGRGRPTGSMNSALGESPSRWNTVAARSRGRIGRESGNPPIRSLEPTTCPPGIPAPAIAIEKHAPQ